jgi:rRNA-processing protein FCF1
MPKKVVLDTNFILYSIRNKTDIFEGLSIYNILVPKQVINELKKTKDSKFKKGYTKESAEVALKILEDKKFKRINLKSEYVDKGIEIYLNENKDAYVATLDQEIRNKFKGRNIIIRNKKQFEIA